MAETTKPERWCFSCGFLAKSPHPDTGWAAPDNYMVQVTEQERLAGLQGLPNSDARPMPVCAKGLPIFSEEVFNKRLNERDWVGIDGFREAILEERDCSEWMRYRVGLDPRWHLEHAEMERLDRASARRDRNANIVMGILALVGIFVGSVQAWKQIDPGVQEVRIVTVTPSIPSTATPER